MTDKRDRFEREVLPHLDAAYNFARWLTRSGADAEDIVQEALLLAFRNFDSKRGANAKPWLLAIVRNCYLSAARRDIPRERRTDTIESDGTSGAGEVLLAADDPEQATINRDHARRLDEVLRLIPSDYREVLILREIEELSYQEIATVTGTPIGTVMSRLSRARTALRSQWLTHVGGTADALS